MRVGGGLPPGAGAGRPRQEPRTPGSHGMPPALCTLDTLEGTVCLVPTCRQAGH